AARQKVLHALSPPVPGSGRRTARFRNGGCFSSYVTTMPKGAAFVESAVGEEDNSVKSPPSTAKPLTARAPSSTVHSVLPSGASRASKAPAPALLKGVLPSSSREPSAAIA